MEAAAASPSAEQLRELGCYIWGERNWLDDMAAALKVRPQVVTSWLHGRTPPDSVWESLRKIVLNRRAVSLIASRQDRLELVWAIRLPIKCGACGHETAAALATLQGAPALHCEACAAELNLSDEKVAATIRRLWDACCGECAPVAPALD